MDPISIAAFVFMVVTVTGIAVNASRADNVPAREAALLRAAERMRESGFEIATPKPFDPCLPVARDLSVFVRQRVSVRLLWISRTFAGTMDVLQPHAASRLTFKMRRKRSCVTVHDVWPKRGRAIVEKPDVRAAMDSLFAFTSVRRGKLAADAVVHDGGYLRVYFKVESSSLYELTHVADALVRLADELEKNRWTEEEQRQRTSLPARGMSGGSGQPVGVPSRMTDIAIDFAGIPNRYLA